jgi:hypothetical protein
LCFSYHPPLSCLGHDRLGTGDDRASPPGQDLPGPRVDGVEDARLNRLHVDITSGLDAGVPQRSTLAAITAAVPLRLMKRAPLFVAERLACFLDENRLAVVAKRYGIRKAKDSDSLRKLFAAYLRRAEESVLGKELVESTILYMATRNNPAQVLHDAAAVCI